MVVFPCSFVLFSRVLRSRVLVSLPKLNISDNFLPIVSVNVGLLWAHIILTRDSWTAWSGDRPVRIGPRFSKFWWSWSDPRFGNFSWSWSGPVPGFEILLGSGLVRSEVSKIFPVLVRSGPRFLKFYRS